MVAPVMRTATVSLPEIYQHNELYHWVEDHLTALQSSANTSREVLEDKDTYRYEADFYNLLKSLGVPEELWYATLRVNGFTNPDQYTEDHRVLLLPSEDDVARIHRLFKTYRPNR